MKSLAVAFAALLAGLGAGASAQVRTIPADAKPGRMSHVQEMVVELDGRQQHLAPGAQIRDASNRVILPAALPAGTQVKYRLDADGKIVQIWVLTPEEAAKP
ncbi:MAG: hypothetical protein M3544_00930 [Pseudomonadota bacterium]|nr:hypothetical protein [Pseudomonadota bacterium]